MSGYWLAVVPAIGGAFALWVMIVMWAPWQRPQHATGRIKVTEAEPAVVHGSMILAEEEAYYTAPLEDPGEWLGKLRDGPTVFDDPPGEDGAVPAVYGTGDAAPLGLGESEPCGVTAPPAPEQIRLWQPEPGEITLRTVMRETRLLRTTGELMRADLLADCCAFMGRQDAEVAVWLAAKMIGEWAA